MTVFVKINLRTKKFSGSEFGTGKPLFKNLAKIPYKKDEVIIYQGNGNNIHPSLWQDEWFEEIQK